VGEFAEGCWCPVGSEIHPTTNEEFLALLNATGKTGYFAEVADSEADAAFPKDIMDFASDASSGSELRWAFYSSRLAPWPSSLLLVLLVVWNE
jgi:hypothetical protein